MKPLLRDGVEYTPGMMVYDLYGNEIKTSEYAIVVKFQTRNGVSFVLRDGDRLGYGLNLLFSSKLNLIKHFVSALETAKHDIDATIEYLKVGGDPMTCAMLEDLHII